MDESKVVWIQQIQKYISMSFSAIRKTLLKQSWNKLKDLTHILDFLFFRSHNVPKELTMTKAMLFKLISSKEREPDWSLYDINKMQCRGCSEYNENFDEEASLNYEEKCNFLIKLIIDNLNDKNPVMIKGNRYLKLSPNTWRIRTLVQTIMETLFST